MCEEKNYNYKMKFGYFFFCLFVFKQTNFLKNALMLRKTLNEKFKVEFKKIKKQQLQFKKMSY